VYGLVVEKEAKVPLNCDARIYQGEGMQLSVGKTGKEVTWCVYEKKRDKCRIFPAMIIEKTRVIGKASRKVLDIYQLDRSLVPLLVQKDLLDAKVAEHALGIRAKPLDFFSPLR